MTQNQISIQYLVKRYRWKHKGDTEANEALDKILWHSLPLVYPNWSLDIKLITKAIETRKQKKKRANRYLKDMALCYDTLSFVTLTFNSETLNSTSERTRHRYVQTWLNENCRDYFANVDYGKKNGREHFHAVVSFKDKLTEWGYGFFKAKIIKNKDDSATSERMSSYLLKLTNHSTKIGTGKSFHKKGMKEVDSLPF